MVDDGGLEMAQCFVRKSGAVADRLVEAALSVSEVPAGESEHPAAVTVRRENSSLVPVSVKCGSCGRLLDKLRGSIGQGIVKGGYPPPYVEYTAFADEHGLPLRAEDDRGWFMYNGGVADSRRRYRCHPRCGRNYIVRDDKLEKAFAHVLAGQGNRVIRLPL